MGACVGAKKQNPRELSDNLTSIASNPHHMKQLRLLKLIYSDMASRSVDGEMSMENFFLFFHKNGYWGERLFAEFDTSKSSTITEDEFIKGIVRIFKSREEKKIQLLYKFFADIGDGTGVSFNNFLRMLYNYPKEDLNQILDDAQFINDEIKGKLVGVENELMDVKNKIANGKAFIYQQSEIGSQKMESKYGAQIIQEMNKKKGETKTTLKLKVGQNDLEIKTTSVHQLVKKLARSIFKSYSINQDYGKLSYENFRDWVIHHKNLYNDYYKGFHNQIWQIDKETGNPLYLSVPKQYQSKARTLVSQKTVKVVLSLIRSVLVVCQEEDLNNPIMLICLEGLSAVQRAEEGDKVDPNGGPFFMLKHRDGVYPSKVFYLQTDQIQQKWMQQLKLYKWSINQIYEIKQKIGTGKFSIVYSCIEKATGDTFAMKIIETFKLSEEAKKVIAHESSIMSLMSHPLLVFFKQCITTKTNIYIVTELVKGKDLFDFVRELKYLGEKEASYVLEQIIIGVRYIHSLGIVHRDLKPENIMLEYDEKTSTIGQIKIIDFGFANYLNNLRQLPKETLWAGTPNYIAPEMIQEEEFDYKIDNFAIGAIMYFMLSGNLPFNSTDVTMILHKTVEGAFTLNDKRWKMVSHDAKELVSRLLEVNPDQRISLDDALTHRWFEKYRRERGGEISRCIVQPAPFEPVLQPKDSKKSALIF